MIVLLSPSKTLNFEKNKTEIPFTQPQFMRETKQLVRIMKKKKVEELRSLMDISEKIAVLNVQRYREFSPDFDLSNAKQSVLAFKGDVYTGLNASQWNLENLNFAQDHLRILSGLYGLLRPLDLIMPYRLEMGVGLAHSKGNNLYKFWGNKLTNQLQTELKLMEHPIVLNLASQEYAKAIDFKTLKGKVIHFQFKEVRNGQLTFISFNAKKARGLMAQFIITQRIDKVEDLKAFNLENYLFDETLSSEDQFVFTR
ncbi:MAG: peroxide stress protein YaaA [Saprospiraceae bacterium]|jgi:cytoplasmic iron level regulating protein YaaA (DUF328/UPF0246 family)